MNTLKASKYYFLVLSSLAGICLGLSWYKPLTPLIFVAFIPLFELTERVYQGDYKYAKLTIWLYAWLTFILWNIVVYWWLWYAVDTIALAAWLANGLLMTLPILLYYIIKKTVVNQFGLFAFLVCWVCFEYLHLQWDLSWIWLNVGNVFAFMPTWVQWYEYTGTFGGTCWVLTANILIYKALSQKRVRVFAALVVLIPIIFSYYLYKVYEEKGVPVEVAIVQPNFDCYTEKYVYNARTREKNAETYIPYLHQVDSIIGLSRKILTPQTAFIAFPETTFHQLKDERNMTSYYDVKKLKYLQETFPSVSVLAGMDSYKILDSPDEHTSATRYKKSLGHYEIFNSALFLSNQNTMGIYRKSKFIIGVETTPFANLLESMTIDLGGITGNLGKQDQRTVFRNSDSLGIAPIICYESVYGEYVTDYVKNGAHILAVITNDGWWDNTPGHLQHLAYSSLRAIETRRPVCRAANTGISGFIDQRGELVKKSRYNEAIALRHMVMANNVESFYVQYGDYIARLCTFLLAFMVLAAGVRCLIVQ